MHRAPSFRPAFEVYRRAGCAQPLGLSAHQRRSRGRELGKLFKDGQYGTRQSTPSFRNALMTRAHSTSEVQIRGVASRQRSSSTSQEWQHVRGVAARQSGSNPSDDMTGGTLRCLTHRRAADPRRGAGGEGHCHCRQGAQGRGAERWTIIKNSEKKLHVM